VKATIEKHGRFSYFWQVGRVRGYTMTKFGAIYKAKKEANSVRRYLKAKSSVKTIDV
jgi:hypothetical protein